MSRKINDIALKTAAINGTIIGRQHLALLRGYLEGIDLTALCDRYGQGELADVSPKTVIGVIADIRQQLSTLAKTKGRQWRDVRLLNIDPNRLATPQVDVSLEEFRNERDPDGFYQEYELLELYQEEYGAHAGERVRARNNRLRRRQILILNWLEDFAPLPPKMSDSVAAWLASDVAKLLEAVGITSIDRLCDLILSRRGWWRGVPGLGAGRARRIEAWLHSFQVSGRPALPAIPLHVSHNDPCTGVVPLEFFKPPVRYAEVVGNILCWLTTFKTVANPNTFRLYNREAERFVLFVCLELDLNPSGKTWWHGPFEEYRQFLERLSNLQGDRWPYRFKRESWQGPRHCERSSHAWRPFEGPLSGAAREVANNAVRSVMRKVFTDHDALSVDSA